MRPGKATLDLKANVSPEEARMIEVLDGDPLGLDDLAQQAGLPTPAGVGGADAAGTQGVRPGPARRPLCPP